LNKEQLLFYIHSLSLSQAKKKGDTINFQQNDLKI